MQYELLTTAPATGRPRGSKTMHRAGTMGSRIMQGAISVLEGRRTVIHFGMAGLLVLGAAACGEDEFDAATAAGVTTAAPARQPASAPATTYAAAHAETTTSAAAMLEESSMENADDYRAAPAATTTDAAFTAPAPSATTFRDYQQSRFVRTSQDRTSTFSLDTDRASFQLALNWARQGYEVDPDSVRAEEWINAFNYAYEHPKHPGQLRHRHRPGQASAGRPQAPGAYRLPGARVPGRPAAQRDAGARRVGFHAGGQPGCDRPRGRR